MKRLLITFAASTALMAVAAQACPQVQSSADTPSKNIVLAQASGTAGSSGSTRPDEPSPLNGFDASSQGSSASDGSVRVPRSSQQVAPDSNNAGGGGTNGDSGAIDPRKTPPNSPPTARQ